MLPCTPGQVAISPLTPDGGSANFRFYSYSVAYRVNRYVNITGASSVLCACMFILACFAIPSLCTAQMCTCITMNGDSLSAQLYSADSSGIVLVENDIWDDSNDRSDTIHYSVIDVLSCRPSRSKELISGGLWGFALGTGIGAGVIVGIGGIPETAADALIRFAYSAAFGAIIGVAVIVAGSIGEAIRPEFQIVIDGSMTVYLEALPKLQKMQFLDVGTSE
jgi:hypothetical protein